MQPPPPPSEIYGVPQAPPKRNNSWIWILVAVLGVCGCGGVLLLAALLFPVFSQAKLAAQRSLCLSNIKRSTLSQLMYATDYDEHLPDSKKWIDLSAKYADDSSVFSCPVAVKSGGQYGYAMSAKLGGTATAEAKTPSSTVLLFETTNLVRNAVGDPKSERNPDRHGKGHNESYLDGSARWIRADGF